MTAITRFEEILVWQKAKELVREVYFVCAEGQFSRDFGLKDQNLDDFPGWRLYCVSSS